MSLEPRHSFKRAVRIAAAALALLGVMQSAHAQEDRDRKLARQLQQQIQKLEQQNSTMQHSLDESQAKADKIKKDAQKDEARARATVRAKDEKITALTADLESSRTQLTAATAEIARLRATLAERDQSLQLATEQHARDDAAAGLLTKRLAQQTARGDRCESLHAGLMDFSGALLARYESDRLRICEPVTGIWKVSAEKDLQQLHEKLYGFRLDAAPGEGARK